MEELKKEGMAAEISGLIQNSCPAVTVGEAQEGAARIMEYLQNATLDEKTKAEKWDALGRKIDRAYAEDDEQEPLDADLITIGEWAASAYGYL